MAAFSSPAYSFDPATGEATFDYALTGPDGDLRFTERVTLPVPTSPPSEATLATLDRVLRLPRSAVRREGAILDRATFDAVTRAAADVRRSR